MIVRFERAARLELEEAAHWYETSRPGLAAEFLDEFDRGIQRISDAPNAWHPLEQGLRRYRLRRFPYGIIYAIHDGEILIVAVAHLHRRPGYWHTRLRP
jgi:toxin ParE2